MLHSIPMQQTKSSNCSSDINRLWHITRELHTTVIHREALARPEAIVEIPAVRQHSFQNAQSKITKLCMCAWRKKKNKSVFGIPIRQYFYAFVFI